jgi:Holliday junction resolvase RusA-like endonuclease
MTLAHQLAEWRARGVEFTVGPACGAIDEMEQPLPKRERVSESLPWPAVIPMPPSVNSMYVNGVSGGGGRGRHKSKAYVAWGWEVVPILAKWKRKLKYPVAVEIVIREKIPNCWDLDNRIKATLDAMVSAEVLKGDSRKYVRKVSIEYAPGGVGVAVTVVESN